jgi:hypothetical protein
VELISGTGKPSTGSVLVDCITDGEAYDNHPPLRNEEKPECCRPRRASPPFLELSDNKSSNDVYWLLARILERPITVCRENEDMLLLVRLSVKLRIKFRKIDIDCRMLS